jgi:hypothetical protein
MGLAGVARERTETARSDPMSTSTNTNRIQQQAADQKMIDGLTQSQQTLPSFMIGNTSVKATDIITTLQGRIKTANTVDSTRATWQAAVKANREERAKSEPLISALRQTLLMMFSGSIETLAEYGLTPRKQPTPRTPEEKAVAAAKALATRKARNTMGPKQKAKIKGVVSPTAPATPPVAAPFPVPGTPVAVAAPVATPSTVPGTPAGVAAPRNS